MVNSINLITPIPGPRSRALVSRREQATPAGLFKSTPIAVAKAHGAVVTDVDGNQLLDFAGGIGVLNVGHTPAEVVEAIQAQAADLIHFCALMGTYEPYVALAEKLNELTPGDFPKKTLLSNSGVEGVENAVKIARYATGRPGIIVFEGGYHGRTLMGLSLTSKYGLFKRGFGPFAPEIYRVPFPNVYRSSNPADPQVAVEEAWAAFERALIAQVDPTAVAAVLIEPVQGEGGFLPCPPEFMRRLRRVCDQHGIVLIADEVQAGFGRTGQWWSIDHTGVVPDIVVSAKSLAAGMPLAATTGRAELMDAPHLGGVGSTYGGNPLACVAALKTIEIIERDKLIDRANYVGEITCTRFKHWQAQYDIIGDVRGLGAMLALEFVADRQTREPLPAAPLAMVTESIKRGVILIRAGLYSNCLRVLFPLVITDEQLNEGLDAMEAALAVVAGG
jgi:4-aminobutyrate aminotransferase/(S)-3-amino-2-methylpropionate transaminase